MRLNIKAKLVALQSIAAALFTHNEKLTQVHRKELARKYRPIRARVERGQRITGLHPRQRARSVRTVAEAWRKTKPDFKRNLDPTANLRPVAFRRALQGMLR